MGFGERDSEDGGIERSGIHRKERRTGVFRLFDQVLRYYHQWLRARETRGAAIRWHSGQRHMPLHSPDGSGEGGCR